MRRWRSAGVVQLADSRAAASETLVKAMPGWLRQGLGAHVTVDGRSRSMRDPVSYTELLCALHPVGPPRLAADRLAATAERTGITRFALLVEGSGDLAATEENVRRLGTEVRTRQSALIRKDGYADLARIACPSLVVACRQDRLRKLEETERMAKCLPHSRFEIIEDCGHMRNTGAR